MGFLIAAALVTSCVIWAATRKPSGGGVVAVATPVGRPAGWQPIDPSAIADAHEEFERGFRERAGVKWTALGNVFIDDAAIRVDLSMLSQADVRKILSLLPAGTVIKGRALVYQLPAAPAPVAAKVGHDLDIGDIDDDLNEVGGGDWGQS